MKTHKLHEWSLSLESAKAIQKNLHAWIITEGACPSPKLIGRIQLESTTELNHHCTVQATIKVQSLPSMQLLERKVAIKSSHFPSRPGLQSFRKVPAILGALDKLNRVPDLFVCDGRGITSHRRFGVASHVGLLTNLPTIGICSAKPNAESNLLGRERGNYLPVTNQGQYSALVRVLDGLDPILVSPGHRIGLQEAVQMILRYIPESTPTRDFLTTLYPAAGINNDDVVQLSLVKTASNHK